MVRKQEETFFMILGLDPERIYLWLHRKLSEKYGPVFTVWLGQQHTVVLCGYEAVKEALIDQGEEFSGRELAAIFKTYLKGHGITVSNGERWKQLRRFSVMTLRNFGMGKKSIESRIQEEARFLLEEFRNAGEMPIDPTIFVMQAISNIICSVVLGNRYAYTDENFQTLLTLTNDNFRIASSAWGELYNIFPNFVEFLPGPHRRFHKNIVQITSFLTEAIKEHERKLDPTSPCDYIDCFLIKQKQERDKPGSEFFRENLIASTINLFFAATETTSTTISYGLLLLLKYPHILEKVQKEIDHVIGHNRCPSMNDRVNMPYTDAVLHEIQRFTDVVPLSLSHCVLQNTKFRGYTIPKGTVVIPLLSSVLHDKAFFENPETFNPGHFLDENGFFKMNDAFMPFSAGKRMCLGQSLARMEIFLFITTLLQNFTLKPAVDTKKIDVQPERGGLLNMPHSYKVCVSSRKPL
ncbi:cytochrome P450 2C15-like [Protopterus annectens]|uniref:cytochrome P450 2C15-like n=1 Tax=Protopterus annectens TaxID=7888 RepID=UPI001CF93C00|nr:cytochrome P450 2C15-like [Protopterus annectens]